jgi:carboxymethylenebutenolidase
MCFDHDSRPPILPIEGGAQDGREITLSSADRARFSAFRARAAEPVGVGVVVLPDVRGLHPYYEDLALRFAEHGVDAVSIDWFGRTAGLGRRTATFPHMEHVARTTWKGMQADIVAAAAYLRSDAGGAVKRVFTVGFCFGGRAAFLSSILDIDLAGAIGFYGNPVGVARNDMPAPADVAELMQAPILGLFGGADEGIPAHAVKSFEASLEVAGIPHQLITYDGAPHSFFDRKADEFARTSERAWSAVVSYVGAREQSSV